MRHSSPCSIGPPRSPPFTFRPSRKKRPAISSGVAKTSAPTSYAAATASRNSSCATAVASPLPLVLGALHAPNYVSGRKYPFLDAVLACARGWRRGPALFVGDTNSGRRGLDEERPVFSVREEGWIDALDGCGWRDAFRHLRPDTRAYTWYSPNGRNGFRIDQAFVNAALLAHLKDAAYVWGGAGSRRRREALSDHAALLVDLADG